MASVRLVLDEFWRHKARRAHPRSIKSWIILALQRTDEAEVDYLEVVVLVEENILRFEVPVGEPFWMQVVNTLDQLLEVVAA